MPDPRVALVLEPATHRLVRTVDAMTDEEWAAPSLLPGWTRTHVVAHLTLNAEALSAALEGVHEGRQVPMYASQEGRDGDIGALAAVPVDEIRDRFLGSTTVIAEWVTDLADNLEAVEIERTPGGRSFRAVDAGVMRVGEVEIHHADLGLSYSHTDWEPDFATLLLDTRAARAAGPDGTTCFTAHAVDLDRVWTFGVGGESGPAVSGPATALAWWTTGRGTGEGVTSDSGVLPRIEAW